MATESEDELYRASERAEEKSMSYADIMPMYSDISDGELYDATQKYDLIVCSGNGEGDMQVQPDKEMTAGRFREPVFSIELQRLQKSRFHMKNVNNAAVTVVGQWRASRHLRCSL